VDVFSRIQIEELLLTFKPTLLFVEHDRAFVEKIATKVIAMQTPARLRDRPGHEAP